MKKYSQLTNAKKDKVAELLAFEIGYQEQIVNPDYNSSVEGSAPLIVNPQTKRQYLENWIEEEPVRRALARKKELEAQKTRDAIVDESSF